MKANALAEHVRGSDQQGEDGWARPQSSWGLGEPRLPATRASDSQAGGPGTCVSQRSGCWWPGALFGGPQAPVTNWRMGPDAEEDRAGPVRDMRSLAMPHEGLPRRGMAQRGSGGGQGKGPPAAPWTGPRLDQALAAQPCQAGHGATPSGAPAGRGLSAQTGPGQPAPGNARGDVRGPALALTEAVCGCGALDTQAPLLKRAGKSP